MEQIEGSRGSRVPMNVGPTLAICRVGRVPSRVAIRWLSNYVLEE